MTDRVGIIRLALRKAVRGCSSGVERNLAKVEVVSSNLITRSIFPPLRP